MLLEIDGVPAETQPTSCSWNRPASLGYNGSGQPVYGQYWSCNLGFDRLTTPDFHRWSEASDGQRHYVQLPHPDSGKHTVYSAFVSRVAPRMNTRDECRAAAAGVDILLTGMLV